MPSQGVVSCREWFVLALDCQKAYEYLKKDYLEFKFESQNYTVQRYFRRQIKSLISDVMKALKEADDNEDNYEDLFHKSANQFKFIYSWCQTLEVVRKSNEDLPREIVYEFGINEPLESYF
jgi:hypothetical protein